MGRMGLAADIMGDENGTIEKRMYWLAERPASNLQYSRREVLHKQCGTPVRRACTLSIDMLHGRA